MVKIYSTSIYDSEKMPGCDFSISIFPGIFIIYNTWFYYYKGSKVKQCPTCGGAYLIDSDDPRGFKEHIFSLHVYMPEIWFIVDRGIFCGFLDNSREMFKECVLDKEGK